MTALVAAAVLCVSVATGCTSANHLRGRYPLSPETIRCLDVCGVSPPARGVRATWTPTDAVDVECLRDCEGVEGAEGGCDDFPQPCVEWSELDVGRTLVVIGLPVLLVVLAASMFSNLGEGL